MLVKFLCVGQEMLLVVSCESRCLYGHSNSSSVSQAVSQCMEKDRQGLTGGLNRGQDRREGPF